MKLLIVNKTEPKSSKKKNLPFNRGEDILVWMERFSKGWIDGNSFSAENGGSFLILRRAKDNAELFFGSNGFVGFRIFSEKTEVVLFSDKSEIERYKKAYGNIRKIIQGGKRRRMKELSEILPFEFMGEMEKIKQEGTNALHRED